MTTTSTKYSAFGNATEFEMWIGHNCDRCQHQSEELQCDGENDLLFALLDDGMIRPETCDFIGTTEQNDEDEYCKLKPVCNHFKPR